MNEWHVLSEDEEARLDNYLFDLYSEKSKHRGDYWHRQADMISGSGDYMPGADDGEPPKGAIW